MKADMNIDYIIKQNNYLQKTMRKENLARTLLWMERNCPLKFTQVNQVKVRNGALF